MGKRSKPAVAERLAELIGPDLQRLDNELAKLSLYQPEQPAITIAAVEVLVGFQHEQQIWDMINALAGRDAATALKKIDELWSIDSKIEYMATGAVFSWVQQVLKAQELADRRMPDAAIGKAQLKLWPRGSSAKSAVAGTSLGPGWGRPLERGHPADGYGQQEQPGRAAKKFGKNSSSNCVRRSDIDLSLTAGPGTGQPPGCWMGVQGIHGWSRHEKIPPSVAPCYGEGAASVQ